MRQYFYYDALYDACSNTQRSTARRLIKLGIESDLGGETNLRHSAMNREITVNVPGSLELSSSNSLSIALLAVGSNVTPLVCIQLMKARTSTLLSLVFRAAKLDTYALRRVQLRVCSGWPSEGKKSFYMLLACI